MRNDLQYDLCTGCGEIKPQGLFATVLHSCPLNTVTYWGPGKFGIRHFHDLFAGRDPLQSFKDLLNFPYLKAMPDFDTATPLDKIVYSNCRDLEIKEMKRLRNYIQLEEKFNLQY